MTRQTLTGAGGAGDTVLFYDEFTDTELTDIVNHTPDIDVAGNGWSEDNGNADINSDRLSALTVPATIVTDVEQAGISQQALWRNLNDFAYQRVMVFRYKDNSNHWYVRARPTDNWVGLYRMSGGVPTEVDTGSFTHAQNNWYGVRVVISGDNIDVYMGSDLDNLGGTPIVSSSGNSTHASETGQGTHFEQVDQRLDDFRVDPALVAP